jgi:hypothetical protein
MTGTLWNKMQQVGAATETGGVAAADALLTND